MNMDTFMKKSNSITADGEELPYSLPFQRYHISDSTRDWDHLSTWLQEMGSDPAVEVNVPLIQSSALLTILIRTFC